MRGGTRPPAPANRGEFLTESCVELDVPLIRSVAEGHSDVFWTLQENGDEEGRLYGIRVDEQAG